MAFMVPEAQHFDKNELIERDERGFRCEGCGQRCKRYNVTAGGEGTIQCLKCAPPEAGWYGRLSAPGYMDSTDWHGPYESREKALNAVMDFYEVDENGDSEHDRQQHSEIVHLSKTRGGNLCEAVGQSNADINFVTCELCLEEHGD